MEKYLGVKLIEAESSRRVDPTDESHEVGYRVIYEDGYTSFSPKDVFEKAYFPVATEITIPNKDLKDYQIRVIDEAKELNNKIEKLDSFILENEMFKSLSEEDQNLLVKQAQAMSYYFTILTKRIKNF